MIKDDNEYYTLLRFIIEVNKLSIHKRWCVQGICQLYNYIDLYENSNSLTKTKDMFDKDIEKLLIEQGY